MTRREKLIQDISQYQDILNMQIVRENMHNSHLAMTPISEKESVASDINDYFEDDFERFCTDDDLLDYLNYLSKLTGITYKE